MKIKKVLLLALAIVMGSLLLGQSSVTPGYHEGYSATLDGTTSIPPGIPYWSQPLEECPSPSALSSVLDGTLGVDSQVANDFIFTGAVGEIYAVRWWQAFWGGIYTPGSCNWIIGIYDDDACLPVNLISEWSIPNTGSNENFACSAFWGEIYEYWAYLSPAFTPDINTTYWISIQAVLNSTPYSGRLCVEEVVGCESAWKSSFHGYPDWIPLSDFLNTPTDSPFELYGPYTSPLTWIGGTTGVENDWHTGTNWDVGNIPDNTCDVVVPAGLDFYPTLTAPGSCKDITLKSDATGTATILDNGLLAVNGTSYVERWFSGNTADWHLVSSPIMNAQAGVFMDMFLQSFDEASNSYTEIIDPVVPLNVMEGYGLYSTLGVDNIVTFSGALNLGPQSGDYTADGLGWNLLGNPYPSSIDWQSVVIPPGLSAEVHYIDALSGANLSFVQGVGGPGSQYIPPGQGFFVSATGPGSLVVDDLSRSHLGRNFFYKNSNPYVLVLDASGESYSDETWIHFNDEANVEHDGTYDAFKRISYSNPALPQIFSISPSGDHLSVNGLPKTDMVPLGFTAVNSGEFTINVIETGEFNEIILEDLFTNHQVGLLSQPYTFSYTEGDDINRFKLHMSLLGINEDFADLFQVYSDGNSIYVLAPENSNSEVAIFNMMGQQLSQAILKCGMNEFKANGTGAYILKIISNNQFTAKKVIVK